MALGVRVRHAWSRFGRNRVESDTEGATRFRSTRRGRGGQTKQSRMNPSVYAPLRYSLAVGAGVQDLLSQRPRCAH